MLILTLKNYINQKIPASSQPNDMQLKTRCAFLKYRNGLVKVNFKQISEYDEFKTKLLKCIEDVHFVDKSIELNSALAASISIKPKLSHFEIREKKTEEWVFFSNKF